MTTTTQMKVSKDPKEKRRTTILSNLAMILKTMTSQLIDVPLVAASCPPIRSN